MKISRKILLTLGVILGVLVALLLLERWELGRTKTGTVKVEIMDLPPPDSSRHANP